MSKSEGIFEEVNITETECSKVEKSKNAVSKDPKESKDDLESKVFAKQRKLAYLAKQYGPRHKKCNE